MSHKVKAVCLAYLDDADVLVGVHGGDVILELHHHLDQVHHRLVHLVSGPVQLCSRGLLWERDRQRETGRESERETDRQTERGRDRQRQRESTEATKVCQEAMLRGM